MTQTVPTAELRAGMTLAAPVHDRSGRLLIPAGMTLQDKHLRVLQAWGVSEVRIQDGDPPATDPDPDAVEGTQPTAGEEDPDAAEARLGATADEALAERFQHCDIERFPMDGIYRIARRAMIDELRQSTRGGSQ